MFVIPKLMSISEQMEKKKEWKRTSGASNKKLHVLLPLHVFFKDKEENP